MRLVVLLAFGASTLFGCQRPIPSGPPEAVVYLKALTITDRTPASTRPVTLDGEMLRTTIRSSFESAGMTINPPGSPGTEQWADFVSSRAAAGKPRPGALWPVRVDLSVIYGLQSPDGVASNLMNAPGKMVLIGAAAIRLPGETESVHERFEIGDGSEFKGDEAAYRAHLKRWLVNAAKRVGARLVEKVAVYELPTPELISALSDESRHRRLDAAERVAMLRHRSAVETLASRLASEQDRAVKLRVVGALAEIGDDRAAQALIAAADPRDRELLRAIVDALSVVGGQRVAEFFQIMSMHDSVEVRELVEGAMKRLKRKRQETPIKASPRSQSGTR